MKRLPRELSISIGAEPQGPDGPPPIPIQPRGDGSIIAPMCWEDILFDLKLRPCVWDQTLPYGFFYRKHASPPLQAFISFVLELLRDETRLGTPPTL